MRRRHDASPRERTRPWWVRPAASAVLVGAVLAATGVLLAARVQSGQDAQAREVLDRRSTAIHQAAAAEVDLYVSALTLVASGIAAAPRLDQETFDAVTGPLAQMDLGGVTSAAFLAPPVATAEVADLQRSWRAEGADGLVLEPSDDVTEHVFSIYSRPLDGSDQRRTGIDVAGFGPPADALTEARISGQPTMSVGYQLIIDQDLPADRRQTSFSLTAPVISQGRHLGWVLMGIRGQDFLGNVLAEAAEGVVRVHLDAPDEQQQAAFVATVGQEPVGRSVVRQQRELDVAQASWSLYTSAQRADLLGPAAPRPPIMAAVGILLGLLVGIVVWLLASGRERAQTKVRVATADLARSESHARRQAALLDTVVVTADTVGVCVIDKSGAFLVHNPTALRILGVDDDGRVRTPLDVPAAHWQEHYGLFRLDGTPFPVAELPLVRALAGESTDGVVMVVRNEVQSAGVQIEVSGRPIDLGDGATGALTIFRDVTEERRQRTQLASFAGVVAHDLNNPLSAARGYVELAARFELPQVAEDPGRLSVAVGHLDRAGSTLQRMSGLIEDLLEYSAAGDAALVPRPVDLHALVCRVVDERLALRPQDAPAAQVHVSPLPWVTGDPDRLDQLFANLVDNALKYVAPGQVPVLDIAAESSPHHVRVLVSDRGIGIPVGAAQRVFEPFARDAAVLADYPGTGLGLAICQRVVQAHRGRLSVIPRAGGGSTFVIDLPAP